MFNLTPQAQEQVRLFTRYGRDLFLFCKEAVGYADLNDQHQQLCTFLQTEKRPKLILTPRYSFKSSVATDAYALWRLSRNDSLRILIYSDSVERAQARLTEIKNHVLGMKPGSQFRKVYGPWETDPKKGVWNQGAITIRPRQTAYAEPSMDTAGIESSKVGAHYDLIIFDDLVTKENTTTKDLMDKTYACYQAARSLLRPGGEVVIVGTRWHYGDMYGRLLEENKLTNQFGVFLRDAEVGPTGSPYPYASIGLTPQFLAEQKASQGSRLYSALYRLDPQDDETAIFKPADFKFYQPIRNEQFDRWVSSLYITAVLDAIPPPTSDHGDDAAITVVGTDAQHQLFVLDAVAKRMHPEQQIEELLSLHAKWHFRKVGLETNAFQRTIKTALERRIAEQRGKGQWEPFTLVEFQGVTQGNKEQRIQGLQPWHERGMLFFPGTTLNALSGVWSQLAFQMLQFPHSPKDDLLDSLAYHLQLKQAGQERPVVKDPPFSSAAWFERRWAQEERAKNAKRPRWARTPVPQLAFS